MSKWSLIEVIFKTIKVGKWTYFAAIIIISVDMFCGNEIRDKVTWHSFNIGKYIIYSLYIYILASSIIGSPFLTIEKWTKVTALGTLCPKCGKVLNAVEFECPKHGRIQFGEKISEVQTESR